jgi:hypothetical protein
MSKRDWRDAKIPQWVREAVEAEMEANKLKLALAWPDEPRPAPAFVVDHDRYHAPESYVGGRFFAPNQGWVALKSTSQVINLERGGAPSRPWGKFFRSERDAVLFEMWRRCDDFAAQLLRMRERVAAAKNAAP